ncbi:DUF4407 domain-containing protein [Virgisporangium ochraceum]|uniref:DUF4407 domain-containing protein n=1 Tax=Virgisporangium ochraceum TaxID=65505 RepID=A0A8J3ZVR3_9ACTN|nr:DUF4407 domain-containing protein [Virgisporangium ochraceum]GIJ70053.1 hypothetical protein Voc01_049700 [Virgisporangium ochraceum]
MTETTVDRPIAGGAGSDPLRPADPDDSFARWPRRLIGVREELLDTVPEERPRYTRLGLILVNTGLMAAVSLFTALQRVVDVPWIAVVPIAVFWGFLVLVVDSWMVSSTHGAIGGNRMLIFVPRLVMAVLLGTVIAEPLVLWIFNPAIRTNVEQFRNDDVNGEASRWRTCNPETGSTQGRPECEGYHLPLKSPQEISDKLDQLTEERKTQSATIETLNTQLVEKQKLAQDECAGVKRDNTSGNPGKGFRCDSAWKVANDFEAQIDLPGKRAALAALDTQINTLTGELATARGAYNRQLEEAIAAKRNDRESSYGQIDIIDEARGLERLSDQSGFVLAANWLVRILLIVVDSLPVLAKMLGGTTSYDIQVHRQLQARRLARERKLEVAERREQAATDKAINEIDRDRDEAIDQIKDRRRTDDERREELLEQEIDRRAARYSEAED